MLGNCPSPPHAPSAASSAAHHARHAAPAAHHRHASGPPASPRLLGSRIPHGLVDGQHETGGLGRGRDCVQLDQRRLPDEGGEGVDDPACSSVS